MRYITILLVLFLSVTSIIAQDSSPPEIIDTQLKAYNDRDIEAFAATYAADITCYEYGQANPFLEGIEALKKSYGALFETSPDLHAVSTNRIVQGNKVIDHEVAEGINGMEAIRVVVIYEISAGLIQKVTFMY